MPKYKKDAPKEGFGRLLELAGSKKGYLTGACVLSVLSSCARLVPFFTIYCVLRELITRPLGRGAMDGQRIWTLALITLAAALVYGVCAYLSAVLSHTAAFNILYDIRIRLMEKLACVSLGFYSHTTQGAVKKTMSDDVEQIEQFIAHHISDIAAAVSLPLATFVYLFVMDWRLALATLFPLIAGMFFMYGGLATETGKADQSAMHDKKEKMQGIIVEYIHGMPVIKVFNRTLSAFQRFEASVTDYTDIIEKITRFFASRMGGFYTAFGAQLLLILPAGLLIAVHSASYADFLPVLLLFFLVGTGIREPMENMIYLTMYLNAIKEGVRRIDRILALPEIKVSEHPKVPTRHDIVFENVSFAYEEGENATDALIGVSFTAQEGTVTGLVGPSGGGKSTIAQLILRFYDVREGAIKIGGVDVRDIVPETLMDMVSFVFQDNFLFCDTVENNIRMGNESATHEQVVEAAKAAQIHDVIAALPKGYATVIGEDNAYLSGGEKQRIAIARVILKDVPIVLLDEATAYADAENETKIQGAFARLAKGKTVIVIAHRLKSVENADQILVMENGRLRGAGRHRELLERETLYRRLVELSERRGEWEIRGGAEYVGA
ncbi:MAG TPA: ABC transporter ATP-binding protein [Anaerovoracaceae bacterium]|nr:ABC transporter ATP-binding protein [Anaerovoracaceae bacterium]